jgi:hypothetical protein
MVIPKNSQHKELAWDFIRTMLSKENSVQAALNGNGPVRSSTFEDPQVKAKLPYAEQEAEAIRHALVPLPPFDGSAQARDIFIEEMQLCVLSRLALSDQLGECAAAGRASTLIRRQLVPDLDDRQGRLLTGAVAGPRGPRGRRRLRRRAVENRGPSLLQRLLDGERELGDLGEPP